MNPSTSTLVNTIVANNPDFSCVLYLGGQTYLGGLMGGELTAEQVRAELPWHHLVVLPEPGNAIAETAAALATSRAIQSV